MAESKDINTAKRIISEGGVVILPTDTIYGFACHPEFKEASDRINRIKGRKIKPFLILDSSEERIRNKYFKQGSYTQNIIDKLIEFKLWPGKITVIGEKNKDIKYGSLEGLEKIAVRFTKNELIRKITCSIGSGIISTSCNISGKKEMTDPAYIRSEWEDSVDLILESDVSGNLPSLIIEILESERCIKIIRFPKSAENENIVDIIKRSIKLCH